MPITEPTNRDSEIWSHKNMELLYSSYVDGVRAGPQRKKGLGRQ